jgi:hypothetical protein
MAALALPAFPLAALTEPEFESRWQFPIVTSAALTKPKERTFLVSSYGSAYRIVSTTSELPEWLKPTISEFIKVQSLPENWDSYAAKRINRDLLSQSLTILAAVMHQSSPAPSVVPLTDGGLQLEWHRKQQDLEVVFPQEDPPQFFYLNRATGKEQEGFASDVIALAQLLQDIA